MSAKIQRPKGTQDILPPESTLWHQVEAMARQTLGQAGYQEARPPIFEHTELFARGVGEDTDIVNKEMFTFEKGERSLTLRPELTASIVRAYLENGLSRWPKPVRLFYIGPAFRYERPQAGRQRQFHQLGVEVFGLEGWQADVEVIVMAWQLIGQVLGGHQKLSLQVNNLGDQADRVALRDAFMAALKPHLNELCDTCQRRYDTNPLRMLDCKNPHCQKIYSGEAITTLLAEKAAGPDAKAHSDAVYAALEALGIPYEKNPRLVRGLDYYTRTVFEIAAEDGLGSQNAVCGGGRYNHLVETLGGDPTPATGWALGLERLLTLTQLSPSAKVTEAVNVWACASDDPTVVAESMHQCNLLRQHPELPPTVMELSGRALGKQLASAEKQGAGWVIIYGEAEHAGRLAKCKRLADGHQVDVPLDHLASTLAGETSS